MMMDNQYKSISVRKTGARPIVTTLQISEFRSFLHSNQLAFWENAFSKKNKKLKQIFFRLASLINNLKV